MFSSTLSLIHQILKALPLALKIVDNDLWNVRERDGEGSAVVFWQFTSSSLKQRKQLTVGEWVRGISPISVGFNPRITNGTL